MPPWAEVLIDDIQLMSAPRVERAAKAEPTEVGESS